MNWIQKDKIVGKKLNEILNELPENHILHGISNKIIRQLIIEGIDIGLQERLKLIKKQSKKL